MQQSTDNPSVGDAAEPQAVTIITEVAPQAAESRPLQPANSATPAATCMSRKREVLLFDASLFPSLTAELSAMKNISRNLYPHRAEASVWPRVLSLQPSAVF